MACNDRQLTQAQREAAFEQQRTAGVVRAARPFSGEPTPENLVDYLNREVYPALRASREKINDVYRQVTDNAPSANPLGYYFSTETANADPTTGRLRLNAATQNTATVIRLSQLNGRVEDVAVWLDVMAGGVTTPLGVITLYDTIDPKRFLRFELDAMTDQGAYWDLSVTPAESSHPNPFVDGEAVFASFIPGVAPSGTVVPVGSLGPIAPSRILGRAEGAGTGDVTELTPTQVVAIIDGENATWTGAHSFTGATHTVNVSGAASITAGTTASITTTTGDINLTPGDDLVVTAADFVAIAATAGSVQFNAGVDVIAIATDDVILTASDNIALTAGTNITAASTADILLNATDGLGLAAGFSVANVSTGDMMLNATSGIGIFAGFASAEVSMSADDVSIGGDSGVAITAGIAAVTNVSAGILLSTANDITLTSTTSVNITSAPRFTSIVTSTVTAQLDNFSVTTANFVRLTPNAGALSLTGMVAAGAGHVLFMTNLSSTLSLNLIDEGHTTLGTASTAANRFQLSGATSQVLGPRQVIIWIYDGTTSRWRANL